MGYSILDETGKQVEFALTQERARDIIRKANNNGVKLTMRKND